MTWGATINNNNRFAAANGDAQAAVGMGVAAATEQTAPKAATAKVFSWNTASSDATTKINIWLNGASVLTFNLTGAVGILAINLVVAAGDELAVEFDSGTMPGNGTYGIYLE